MAEVQSMLQIDRMFRYGVILGLLASAVLIHYGRLSAPLTLPSYPPTEVHPS